MTQLPLPLRHSFFFPLNLLLIVVTQLQHLTALLSSALALFLLSTISLSLSLSLYLSSVKPFLADISAANRQLEIDSYNCS